MKQPPIDSEATTVTVRFPSDMLERIKAEARANFTNRATICRQAVAAWLDAAQKRRAITQNTTNTTNT